MSEASPPSMLPNAPREPAYVDRLRDRLRTEIETRRRTERENLRLRTEIARLLSVLRRAYRSRGTNTDPPSLQSRVGHSATPR
jgi:hypothetical protein